MPSINLLPPSAFPAHPAPAGTRTIGARTEHVAIARANGGAHAKVEWIEHLGDQNHLHLAVGEHKLVTLVDPEVELSVGDAVDIALRQPLYFGADGERIRGVGVDVEMDLACGSAGGAGRRRWRRRSSATPRS